MPTSSADVLVRAIMQGDTGLPADVFVNDFAFRLDAGGSPSSTDLDNVLGAVDNFYNAVTPSGAKVAGVIGEAVDRGATHTLEVYSISAGGSPLRSDPWLGPAAPSTANSNLPTEVAAVLSFHGDLTSIAEESGGTRPRARRRGRIYIGPLTTDAVAITDDDPRLVAAWTTVFRQAAIVMHDAAEADGWTWSVWSRAANELYEIVGGWTDNAPDTQRRRGAESTSRITYTV